MEKLICYYHKNQSAASQCVRCGKYLCPDCASAFPVTLEEYEGKTVCYDCYHQIVSDNIESLKKQKKYLIFRIVLLIAGFCIGFFVATNYMKLDFLACIFVGLFCGVFLSATKAVLSNTAAALNNMSLSVFNPFMLFMALWCMIRAIYYYIKAMFVTVHDFVYYIINIRKLDGFIKSDTAALQAAEKIMLEMTGGIENETETAD